MALATRNQLVGGKLIRTGQPLPEGVEQVIDTPEVEAKGEAKADAKPKASKPKTSKNSEGE